MGGADDANDLGPFGLAVVDEAEALAEGAATGPELLREGVVDDHLLGVAGLHAGREGPALDKLDAEGVEIAGGDHHRAGARQAGGIAAVERVAGDLAVVAIMPERQRGREGDALHARQGAEPALDAAVELDPLLGLFIAFLRHRKNAGEHARGFPARVLAEQAGEAAVHHAGAAEQHEGERDLGHDERMAHVMVAAAGGGAARLGLERAHDVGARGQPGRHDAEDDAGERRGGDGQQEHLRADRQLQLARPAAGVADDDVGLEQAVDPQRDEQAEAAADRGKKDALDELLADEAGARGAERGADGEVAHRDGGAGELEIGQVGAGDQQHKSREAEQHPRDLAAFLVHDGLVQRQRLVAEAGVVLWEILFLDGGQRTEFGADLLRGDAGFQAAGERKRPVGAAAALVGGEGERTPESGVAPEETVFKRERHDTDDGVRVAVDAEHAADDRGIAAVAFLPETVGQQHDLILAGLRLLGGERAADLRLHAEGVEHVCVGEDAVEALGGLARLGHGGKIPGVGRQRQKGGRLVAQLALFDFGEIVVLPAARVAVERDQALRLGEGRVAEEQRIDEAEHRGVHADAERQGDQGDDRETRVLEEGAEGKFHFRFLDSRFSIGKHVDWESVIRRAAPRSDRLWSRGARGTTRRRARRRR